VRGEVGAGLGEADGSPARVDRGVHVRGVTSPLEPGAQGEAQVGQVPGEVGVAGRGEIGGPPARVDRGVHVRGVTSPLEPGAQGEAQD